MLQVRGRGQTRMLVDVRFCLSRASPGLGRSRKLRNQAFADSSQIVVRLSKH